MNKHKIAWIALAAAIVMVMMLTWLVGVSPRLVHIKEADAQTAQIDASNKATRNQIETLRVASETIGLQKDRLPPVAASDPPMATTSRNSSFRSTPRRMLRALPSHP